MSPMRRILAAVLALPLVAAAQVSEPLFNLVTLSAQAEREVPNDLLTAVLDSDWPRDTGNVTMIGINTLAGALFRDWLLPFELVSVVLLIALIGAIVIGHQEEGDA